MIIIAGEQFPENVASITCSHVLEGSPIHLVARDVDGDWQFLCRRSSHVTSEGRVIGLAEALKLEPRLSFLSPLHANESVVLNP